MLPIAETFHSFQGEGFYTGKAMKFIRLAGCTVGRYEKATDQYSICTAWGGKRFTCDTDYKLQEKIDEEVLLADVWEKHICLTGGEPLMHDIAPLLAIASRLDIFVSIETSGTIRPIATQGYPNVWLCVSPKQGCLDEVLEIANEIKILVDEGTTREQVEHFANFNNFLYLQPINGLAYVDLYNLTKCYQLLKDFPSARLSFQVHKLVGWR